MKNNQEVVKQIQEKLNESNDGVDKKDFDKLQERVNGNDSLIDGLIGKVKKITSDMKTKAPASNKEELEDRLKQIEKMVSEINEDKVKNQPNNELALDFDLENRLKVVEKEIDDIKSTVPLNTAASNDGTTHSSINYNLKKKIDSMSKDSQEMKSALISWQQILNSKADFDQLQEIDKVVTDKLNDWIKAVKRQMQEKADSTKNLKKLEKQLRSLYDVLYNQIALSDEEDDPLMGKKTISGYSYSPYEGQLPPKGQTLKYQVWK
jgi:hypothetical protein